MFDFGHCRAYPNRRTRSVALGIRADNSRGTGCAASAHAAGGVALTRCRASSTMTLANCWPSMRRLLSFGSAYRTAACVLALIFAGAGFFVGARACAEKTDQLKPQGYVNDFAGVLSPTAKAQLTA